MTVYSRDFRSLPAPQRPALRSSLIPECEVATDRSAIGIREGALIPFAGTS